MEYRNDQLRAGIPRAKVPHQADRLKVARPRYDLIDLAPVVVVHLFVCGTRSLRHPVQVSPAILIRFRREGVEVLGPVWFSTRGTRRRTQRYVEHAEARKHRWVRHIDGRSRKLLRIVGEEKWRAGRNSNPQPSDP